MLPILINQPWLVLYAYPFFMGIGWAMGYIVSENQLDQHSPSEKKYLPLIFVLIFLSAWLGSKALFLLVTTPVERLLYAKASNFWLGGGFVFYGGLIGALLAVCLLRFFLKQKLSWHFFKLLLPGLILGHAIGRVGCFLAGCCFGKEAESFFAIAINGTPRIPVQLLEAIALFMIYKFINHDFKKQNFNRAIYCYFLLYGGVRFFLEFLRADEMRGFYFHLSTSQWASLVLMVSGGILYFKKINTDRL